LPSNIIAKSDNIKDLYILGSKFLTKHGITKESKAMKNGYDEMFKYCHDLSLPKFFVDIDKSNIKKLIKTLGYTSLKFEESNPKKVLNFRYIKLIGYGHLIKNVLEESVGFYKNDDEYRKRFEYDKCIIMSNFIIKSYIELIRVDFNVVDDKIFKYNVKLRKDKHLYEFEGQSEESSAKALNLALIQIP
jgi:hypothetical protein